MQDVDNILVSVSGGLSSAMMAWLMKLHMAHLYNLVFVIANTGKEREETLVFADRCDREWGLGLIWVEAVVHPGKQACTHKVVNFQTASRNGEPFEAVIQKYGIPNMNYLHCTRELKANAIRSYLASIGWTNYLIAQGMRADEPRRNQPKTGIIYPLTVFWPTTKAMVNDWWEEQPFSLGLLEHQGNCDACHKKNITKLVRLAKERPETFDWWGQMETSYGLAGHNVDGTPRTFFRGHRSAQDIVAISRLMTVSPMPDLDEDGGCSESCEPFEEVQ